MAQTFGGIPIIDDSTRDDGFLIFPPDKGRGLLLPPPYLRSYAGVAEPFPDNLKIPQSEWQARIQEIESRNVGIRDVCDRVNLPPKDQEQTNFCWINSPTYCVEVLRVVQNEPMIILSPASAGAQITGYQNVGGFGKDGLEFIQEHGLVPVGRWPANAIDRRYATPENLELARQYRQDEWWALGDDFDAVISCLLRDVPVTVGLGWWSHQVTYVAAQWVGGAIAVLFRNSWGRSYGDDGYGILQGQRMYPDDACAPRTAFSA